MSEKMKIKDLARELGITAKELQKECGKLNIEAPNANFILAENDVQKIKEYREAHANDKIEQHKTTNDVIVRRRRNASDETKSAKKEKEVKADNTNKETEAKTDTKTEKKPTEKKEKAEVKAEVKTEQKVEKVSEKKETKTEAKTEKPKQPKAKKVQDTPARIITPAKVVEPKPEVKPEVKVEPAKKEEVENKEKVSTTKPSEIKETKENTENKIETKTEKIEAKPEVKKAPAASAMPDSDSAKSILPPAGQKATKVENQEPRASHEQKNTRDQKEPKKEGSQVRVISRPEQNTARVIGKAENNRNENRDRDGGKPNFRRDGNRDNRDNNREDRPRNRDNNQRRDGGNRFQGGMDKDKDAPQQNNRPPRQNKPASSFRMGKSAFMPQVENEQSRKKRNKNRRTVEFGQNDNENFRRRNNNNNSFMLDDDETVRYRSRSKKNKKQQVAVTATQPMKAAKRKIRFEEAIRVADLAHQMSLKSGEIIKVLFNLGVMATINSSLDIDTATLVASEFDYEVEKVGFSEENYLVPAEIDSPESLLPRPPVVTIMGHVDHGKTSLLDAIRKTSVTSGEAGGITQHIGAYHVKTKRGDIVFLDTPGHEAFTAMRARGAQVTDLVVLVVAADDGVMEQTREAINHSKAAGVPILVAVNKIDKPTANPDRVLQELASLGLQAEDWGGDTVVGYVSAKTGQGLDDLLELIALQAEILELKANPDKPARGHVVEAKLDKGRGPVATVLIQEGTLKQGDAFVCGVFAGRVRAFFNDQGKKVKEAGPSIPVEIQGFDGVPEAGEEFICLTDEKAARRIADARAIKQREKELAKQSRVTLETFLASTPTDNEAKVLNLVLKADVQGSLEAITDALHKLSTDKVRISVIHSGAGTITETDIMLAAASNAIIIGFNVRPTAKVKEVAEREMVDIRFYDIIYKLVEEIKSAMAGMLAPVSKEVYLGQAEVRQTFSVPKVGVIAGCMVNDGKIQRNGGVRLLRDGVVVYTGKILSLRRVKDDVKEVAKGYECGIGLENFNDIKIGDILECFEMVEEAATLD